MEQLNTVIGILTEIRDTLTAMAELSEKKQGFLIKGDPQAVLLVVKEETELQETLSKLEKNRMEIHLALQNEWGIEGSLTLKDIEAQADADKKLQMERLRLELKKIITKQKSLNDQNAQLIQLHFEYMNFMKYFMLQDMQSSDIYGDSGIVKEIELNVGMIDSRV